MLRRLAKLSFLLLKIVIYPSLRRLLYKHMLDYVEEQKLFDVNGNGKKISAVGVPAEVESIFRDGVLVTTSSGLFLLKDESWNQLMSAPGYGVAVGNNCIFLVCSVGSESHIFKSEIRVNKDQVNVGKFSRLCSLDTRYHGDRMHQICWDGINDRIVCANTRRNSILFVDPLSGEFMDEIFPFTDRFGAPIHTDHNHLNGVFVYNETVLFSVHTMGLSSSGLGVINNKRVRVYEYKGRGVHDVLMHGESLLFCDSFRSALMTVDDKISGAIIFNGREYLSSEIESLGRQLIVRGLSIRDNLLCAGGSVYTKREKRLDGEGGGLFVFVDEKLASFVPGPFSQVYDVVPLDGEKSNKVSSAIIGDDSLHKLFLSGVGECVYDEAIVRDKYIPLVK